MIQDLNRAVKVGGEFYNVTGDHTISDADHILDRNWNAAQSQINQQLFDVITKSYNIVYTPTFTDNNFLIKVLVYINKLSISSLPSGYSVQYAYQWADGSISAEEWNDITMLLWNYGVNKTTLFSHNPSGHPEPVKVMVRLVKDDKHIILDQIVIDLIQENVSNSVGSINNIISDILENTYTKTQVDTMLASIEAGGSGDTNLQEANLQDIQAVFNMQYQQASPEVIDPHDNP